jgi:broad specificity phosphatase PhoE/ribonuclease HI
VVRLLVEADGGSRGNPGPAGYGAVVRDAATGEVLAEVADSIGTATNNVAEYRGLIAGLEAGAVLEPESVEVRMDSKLVVEQMSGRWKVKHPAMAQLKAEADEIVRRLPRVRFTHVRRAMNSHADRLANEAMDAAARGERWVRRTGVATATGPANRMPGWMDAPAAPTTLMLLRHGETALSVERRFSGVGSDPELTPRGRTQSTAAAQRIELLAASLPIAAVYSSPLRRARATAAEAAATLGLEVIEDQRLRETDFGEWEGHTFAQVRDRWPAELAAWLSSTKVAPPGGESFDQTLVRVRRARGDLLARHPGQTVLVVTHVTPIKTLLRLALDAGPAVLYRIHLDLASLSLIDWYADGPAVVRLMNDTAHLGAVLDTDGVSTPTAEPVEPVSTT